MYISKQLFLITAVCLSLGFQINASQNEEQDSGFLNFTRQLIYQHKTADDINTGNWMNAIYQKGDPSDENTINQLMNITNSDKTDEEKKADILALKNSTTGQNKSYFSSISTFTKAAAAFVIAASIASYFYFMRPWSTSAQ
jgi:hypothetical protein